MPAISNRQKDFIAEIKQLGLARTNRFLVEFTPPSSGAANYEATKRKTMLFCEKASLPGINLATAANRSYGETREAVYDKMYDGISLTFHVDARMTIKKMFDDWMHSIISAKDRTHQYYNNYTSSTMKIQIQDLTDKTMYEVTMYEVYPKTLTTVTLDAEAKDTMRLDVQFVFRRWTSSLIYENSNGQLITADEHGSSNEGQGWESRLNKGLGEAKNFLTGAVGQYAMRSFSQFTSRVPSIKF